MTSGEKIPHRDELVKRWQELVEKFDKELRDKGLTDAQREQLLQELLEDEDEEVDEEDA